MTKNPIRIAIAAAAVALFLFAVSAAHAAPTLLFVDGGGTGRGFFQSGSVLLGNGSNAIATTTRGDVTATGITVTGGANAILGSGLSLVLDLINLASRVTGTLPVANGGTGVTTFGGTNRVLFTSAADTLSSASSFTYDGTTLSAPVVAATQSGNATSTFAGNVQVSGNLRVDGMFYAPVSIVSSGNTTINGTITSTGASSASGFQASSLGLVGTPAYSFSSDLNTGMWSSGADTLALSTAGVQRLTVNSSGNVGIGTTSPYAKLSVVGQTVSEYFTATSTTASTFPYASTTALTVSGGANALTIGSLSGMLYANSGAVNTATISAPLSFSAGTLSISQATASTNGYLSSTDWSTFNGKLGSTTISALTTNYLPKWNGSAFANSLIYDDGTNVGVGTTTSLWPLTSYSASSPQLALSAGAGIAQWTFRNAGGNLYLATTTAAGTATTSPAGLTILGSNGNIGIGTTSPTKKLSVTGTVAFDGLTASIGAGSLCLTAGKEVVYNAASDNCLSSTRASKHSIESISLGDFSILEQLQPVSFVYNDDASSTQRFGFIAEDAAAADPHLATRNASGEISGLDTNGFLAVIVDALKKVVSRQDDTDARLEALEARLTALESENATLRTGRSVLACMVPF